MAAITFDLHTHTLYSHGKGTIEQNAAAAEAAGLEMLGIADHGPGHRGFGIKLEQLSSMRSDIKAASEAHPGIKVLLGVEANIIDPDGELDVSKEQTELFDYIIAGYHYGVFGKAPVRAALVHASGFWYRLAGTSSRAVTARNTELVIKALENNSIKIISHPGEKASFDIAAIAECCARRGTWMEINDHHKCLTAEGIRIAEKYGVSFVLGSDAHRPENVARVERALERVRLSGLDTSRIVNYRGI